MELDKPLKTRAYVDLGEDDLKRKQSLDQFREWISNQKHFKNCQLGS